MTVDNTYLDTAVDRLVEMYEIVLAPMKIPVKRIKKYIDTGLTAPCLWLSPGAINLDDIDYELDGQEYSVMARLSLGSITEGYDGVLAGQLWVVIPTVINYFNARRALIYQDGQEEVPYLIPNETRVSVASGFGQFTGSSNVGIAFQHRLAFAVDIEHFEEIHS